MKKLFYICLLGLLISCNEPSDSPINEKLPDATIPPSSDGVSSTGGGGFGDIYAMDTLNLAKYSLTQMIENLSDDAFTELPEEKRKDWLLKIIRNIEIKPVYEERYGRPLKFNYDLENETIHATRYYVDTFPYGRFFTKSDPEKNEIIYEVYLDILHELAHFFNIGVTEDSDVNSEFWALDFINRSLEELIFCESVESENTNQEQNVENKISFIYHIPSGLLRISFDSIYEEEIMEYGSGVFSFYHESDSDTQSEKTFISILRNAKQQFNNKLSPILQEYGRFYDEEYLLDELESSFIYGSQRSLEDIQDEYVHISFDKESNGHEFKWSGVGEELYGFSATRGEEEKSIELEVLRESSLKINLETMSAEFFFKGSPQIKTLTEEQIEFFRVDNFKETKTELGFKCGHKKTKIGYTKYQGDEVIRDPFE